MKQYKGYYIDNVIFNSEEEIDNFLKAKAVERFKAFTALFSHNSCMEYSIACSEQADVLHDQFGFSWDEIEQMEIEAFKSIA